MAKKQASEFVQISRCEQETIMVAVVGTAPLIFNRMSEKVKQQLLMGAGKKTAAEKAGVAKHDPIKEFLASPYRMRGEDAPALLGFPSSAFKGAMETAALETPGAKKSQVGRLISVPWDNVPVYGIPQILCSVTRSADMAKTPDIRTRAIIRYWACSINVSFVTPALRPPLVMALLANAGIVAGIGDWRQEKGAGSFGTFRVTSPEDEEFQRIVASGGREAQVAAMENPHPFDDETAELLEWYTAEFSRRGFKIAS